VVEESDWCRVVEGHPVALEFLELDVDGDMAITIATVSTVTGVVAVNLVDDVNVAPLLGHGNQLGCLLC